MDGTPGRMNTGAGPVRDVMHRMHTNAQSVQKAREGQTSQTQTPRHLPASLKHCTTARTQCKTSRKVDTKVGTEDGKTHVDTLLAQYGK